MHWKILVLDFWQGLGLYQKPCFLFKKRKLLGAITKKVFILSPWNFVHGLYAAMLEDLCDLGKNTIFLTFVCRQKTAKENTCGNFQRKTMNSTEMEPLVFEN